MKLLDYIRGDKRGRDAHRIELDAMSDAFLNESLEGYDAVEGDHAESLQRLLDSVRARTESKSRWPVVYWTACAIAALCVVTGGVFYVVEWSRSRSNQGGHDAPGLLATIIGGSAEPVYELPEESSLEAARAETDSILSRFAPQQNDSFDTKIVQPSDLPTPAVEAPVSGVPAAVAAASATPERTTVPAVEPAAATVRKPAAPEQTDAVSRSAAVEKPAPATLPAGTVSGRVTDAKGQPLENVMVISEKKQQGVMTDRNGNFRMDNLPESDQLVVALFGYESHRIDVPKGDSSPMKIVMRESSSGRDEIVIEGYGTLKKSGAAGTVATVESQAAVNEPRRSSHEEFMRYVAANRTSTIGESGSVVASFKVGSDGRPTAIRIEQSLSAAADREVQRLLRNGPGWPPGEDRVRVTIDF